MRVHLNKKIMIPLILIQYTFWFIGRNYHSILDITLIPPNKQYCILKAAGDSQLAFRMTAFTIQTMGDSYGRFTPLENYDYTKLIKWFQLGDQIEMRSTVMPAMASYLYSTNQKVEENKKIVSYLVSRSLAVGLDKSWWWMLQAMVIADSTLKDTSLMISIGDKLLKTDAQIPFWARAMVASMLITRPHDNRLDIAQNIVNYIAENQQHLTPKDEDYISRFLVQRLAKEKEKLRQLQK